MTARRLLLFALGLAASGCQSTPTSRPGPSSVVDVGAAPPTHEMASPRSRQCRVDTIHGEGSTQTRTSTEVFLVERADVLTELRLISADSSIVVQREYDAMKRLVSESYRTKDNDADRHVTTVWHRRRDGRVESVDLVVEERSAGGTSTRLKQLVTFPERDASGHWVRKEGLNEGAPVTRTDTREYDSAGRLAVERTRWIATTERPAKLRRVASSTRAARGRPRMRRARRRTLRAESPSAFSGASMPPGGCAASSAGRPRVPRHPARQRTTTPGASSRSCRRSRSPIGAPIEVIARRTCTSSSRSRARTLARTELRCSDQSGGRRSASLRLRRHGVTHALLECGREGKGRLHRQFLRSCRRTLRSTRRLRAGVIRRLRRGIPHAGVVNATIEPRTGAIVEIKVHIDTIASALYAVMTNLWIGYVRADINPCRFSRRLERKCKTEPVRSILLQQALVVDLVVLAPPARETRLNCTLDGSNLVFHILSAEKTRFAPHPVTFVDVVAPFSVIGLDTESLSEAIALIWQHQLAPDAVKIYPRSANHSEGLESGALQRHGAQSFLCHAGAGNQRKRRKRLQAPAKLRARMGRKRRAREAACRMALASEAPRRLGHPRSMRPRCPQRHPMRPSEQARHSRAVSGPS